MAPNGIATRTNKASAIHHERFQTPNKANGNRLGLRRIQTAGQYQSVASAMTPVNRSTGLPATRVTSVPGHQRQNAMTGHHATLGRWIHAAQMTAPTGSAQ